VRPPFLARVAVLADELFFLGVHADHRIPAVLMGLHLATDIPELAIPVRVLGALDRAGVGLQAEPLLAQQVPDGIGAGLVALAGQLSRQRAG
jgi:hypothetical protein